MIPYFEFTTFNVGPIPLQVWGFMVAVGIIVGTWVAAKLAVKRGQDSQIIWDLSFYVIIAAFIGARLFHIAYEPQFYMMFPEEILKIWHGGFSIMGGFAGALIAGLWFLKKKKVDVYAYCDTAVFGLPIGLFIGRIGCFLIHDHPGTLSDFVLAVNYPGGARHDHGLYLSINGLLMFLVFLWLLKKKVKTGTYIVVFLIWYGAVRFFLDFLRATDGSIVDVRYLSLTPAQYVSILMFSLGLWMLWKHDRSTTISG